MRKILILLLASFSLFPQVVFAQEEEAAIGLEKSGIPDIDRTTVLRPRDGNVNFLGQDHNYTLTLRGNGEAVVVAKYIFSNTGDKMLNNFELRVPKVQPKDIIVYQVIAQRQCIRYKSMTATEEQRLAVEEKEKARLDPSYTPVIPNCLEYEEGDFYSYYGPNSYQKADYSWEGDTLKISLPKSIAVNKSASVMLYFPTFGYVAKNIFGVYNYNFETLKVNDRIQNLNVGIQTDSDFVLRGANANVNYGYSDPELAFSAVSSRNEGIVSSQLDSFYQNIGQGNIYKYTSNLSPLESYTVKGSYADSLVRLYAKEATFSFIGLVVLGVILGLIVRYIARLQTNNKYNNNGVVDYLQIGVFSFGSGFVIVLYTLFLYFVSEYFQNYGGYSFNIIFILLLTIVSFGIYVLVLFLPSIYLGLKKGWRKAVVNFGLTILWLFIFLITLFIIITFLGRQDRFSLPPVIPLDKTLMDTQK